MQSVKWVFKQMLLQEGLPERKRYFCLHKPCERSKLRG